MLCRSACQGMLGKKKKKKSMHEILFVFVYSNLVEYSDLFYYSILYSCFCFVILEF